MTDSLPTQTAIVRADTAEPRLPTVLTRLAAIPKEDIWLAKHKSARTRRAYGLDVRHFMATLHITTTEELRRIDHRAMIAWKRTMREEVQKAAGHRDPSTTKLYDRQGYNPEKAASFFATY